MSFVAQETYYIGAEGLEFISPETRSRMSLQPGQEVVYIGKRRTDNSWPFMDTFRIGGKLGIIEPHDNGSCYPEMFLRKALKKKPSLEPYDPKKHKGRKEKEDERKRK